MRWTNQDGMAPEVVVVGAGPGGSSTAYFLAKAGYDVKLLDRAEFPREKVCGGAISPRALNMLDELGIYGKFEKQGFQRIRGVKVRAPNGKFMTGDAPEGNKYRNFGFTVRRTEFDDLLRNHAIDAGAEFQGGTFVKNVLRKNGRPTGVIARIGGANKIVTADLIIGADGPGSMISRAMGLNKRELKDIGVANRAYFANVEGLSEYVEFHYDLSVLPGYAWIFPLGDGTANIGLGGIVPYLKKADADIFKLIDKFVGSTVADRLKGAKLESKILGWPLPMGGAIERSYADNVMLVGDAAHMVNPLTGEGIEYAMEAGKMAAEVGVKALEERDTSAAFLKAYETEWRSHFTEDYKYSIKIRKMLMARPWLMNIVVGRAQKKEKLAQLMAGVIANITDKKEAGSPFRWLKYVL